MFRSMILSILIICGFEILKVSTAHIKKEDICSAIKNLELEVPCSKLESSFIPTMNCTSPEEGCMDKEKLDDCLHGLIFNGTKYSEDNECLQFYCKCFDGKAVVNRQNESDSQNVTLDMECNNCTETTTEVEVTPENLTNHTEAAEMPEADGEMVFVSEHVDSNHTIDKGNETSTTPQLSGKYIRPADPQQPPEVSGNQRRGDRKPDYSTTTTHYTQETSTKNIYDRDDEDYSAKNKKVMNPNANANNPNHHDESKSEEHHNAHSNAPSPSRRISVQALLIAFFTSFFFSFSTFFLFFLSIGNFL